MERVLFLDIDGVLNSDVRPHRPRRDPDASYIAPPEVRECGDPHAVRGWHDIDPERVARLQRIVDATGCVLVISSTWRKVMRLSTIRLLLAAHGLRADVIDATPFLASPRGEEIRAWLDAYPGEVGAFAVLDDNDQMDAVREAFVLTWDAGEDGLGEDGLAEAHVERVIALLRPA